MQAVIVICMVSYVMRGKTLIKETARNPLLYAALVSVVCLTLIPSEASDVLVGNFSFLVTSLLAVQIELTTRQSKWSNFAQGFVLSCACWLKPNIVLILWFMFVFSLRRRQHGYWLGLLAGFLCLFAVSLLAPNISLLTYQKFFSEAPRMVYASGINRIGSLTFLTYVGREYAPDVQKVVFFVMAFLVAALAGKGKTALIEQEIPVIFMTIIPWPIIWPHYVSWLSIGFFLLVVNRIGRENLILEMICISVLGWSSFIYFDPVGFNLSLVILIVLYYKNELLALWKKQIWKMKSLAWR
jgi:hypothetical protein